MSGVERIAAERQRQIELGYDADHDDLSDDELLAYAAAVYALPIEARRHHVWNTPLWRLLWPQHWTFKGAVDTQAVRHGRRAIPRDARIRELEKAGALVAAEIDRLERESA